MINELNNKKVLILAQKTVESYKLCDACLGRLYAKIEHGLTNEERGKQIRKYIKKAKKTAINDCWLCQGLLHEIDHFTKLIADALREYEFDTFLVGSKIDEDIQERERELEEFTKSEHTEPLKMEVNREVGKRLENMLGKVVNFEKPTIMAVIDTAFDVVNLQISSLYLYGRYKKFVRDIPQTKWHCRVCWGKGCKRCNYTGKLYETSIEELIAKKVLDLTCGTDESFHGSGREDIDARMLGNGRPFVVEIINPRTRIIDLSQLQQEINTYGKGKIEVGNLRYSDKDEIIRLKKADFRKKYRVTFTSEKLLNREKLNEAAQILPGVTIHQFTPSRVSHRRAEKVRKRKIYTCEIESLRDNRASMIVETDSGTYIKELISGDMGKTKPNISDMMGIPCIVQELDVIEIKGE